MAQLTHYPKTQARIRQLLKLKQIAPAVPHQSLALIRNVVIYLHACIAWCPPNEPLFFILSPLLSVYSCSEVEQVSVSLLWIFCVKSAAKSAQGYPEQNFLLCFGKQCGNRSSAVVCSSSVRSFPWGKQLELRQEVAHNKNNTRDLCNQ